jgi:hypothetical protein
LRLAHMLCNEIAAEPARFEIWRTAEITSLGSTREMPGRIDWRRRALRDSGGD